MLSKAGKKLSKGSSMFSEKAVVLEKLEQLIKQSTYNNWGDRKPKDPKNVVGFLNFKSKLIIDGEKRHVRIAIEVRQNGDYTFKNYEVDKKFNAENDNKNVSTIERQTSSKFKDTKNNLKGVDLSGLTIDDLSAVGMFLNSMNKTEKTVNHIEKTKPVITKTAQPVKQKNSVLSGFDNSSSYNADDVVSASELIKTKFDTVKIRGVFGKLLGEIFKPFYLMIYGSSFNGKSSVALLFADALAKQHKYKILYVANEEGVTATMQEKIVRLGVTSNIDLVENLNTDLFGKYDVVFVDSTQTTAIKPVEFKELKQRFPDVSFVLINKANRDGSSKGGTDWVHDVDAVMHVEDGAGMMEKNRFPNGGSERIKIF